MLLPKQSRRRASSWAADRAASSSPCFLAASAAATSSPCASDATAASLVASASELEIWRGWTAGIQQLGVLPPATEARECTHLGG